MFIKTEHFLLRQWERKVPDEVLASALKDVNPTDERRYVNISRKITSSFSLKPEELFVLINKRALITCFFENLSTFRNQKTDVSEYLIISEK